MYYDLGQWSIVDETKVLIGDCVRFLESGYANKGRIDVYIDHFSEPLCDFIE